MVNNLVFLKEKVVLLEKARNMLIWQVSVNDKNKVI